jgi:Cu2+-exporting ATPase
LVAERFVDKIKRRATESVTASSLIAEDIVLIRAGAVVPADGIIVEGTSHVEEAMLTGESFPRGIKPDDSAFAGSVNRENALVMRVTAAGEGTRLATILRLVDRASSERPKVAKLADRVASWFVGALLLLTVVVGIVWGILAPDRALSTVFALLVISCPCALSLATPAALSAAAGALGKRHVLLSRSDALEALSCVTTMVFDKTGTLTKGSICLTDVFTENDADLHRYTGMARALEARSEHPIAVAFRAQAMDNIQNDPTPQSEVEVTSSTIHPGLGIEGIIDGQAWRIGRASFVSQNPIPSFLSEKIVSAEHYKSVVFLGRQDTMVAAFAFSDTLRDNAKETIAALSRMGIKTVLLSGDREVITQAVARDLGIDVAEGGLMPEEKRDRILAMQNNHEVVAMIGDGINDAPALAQAQISVSLGSATSLAQWTADVLILSDELPRLTEVFICAQKTLSIVKENLIWAAGYNLLAIPSAALGWVTPLFAAIGMSLSSLIVVLNALRALRFGKN